MHTNTFELFAVHIALKRFMPFLQGIIRSDNSLTVANVNHQGGTRSGQLLWVAKNPLTWAVRCLQSTYLLGEQNQVADFLGTNPMGSEALIHWLAWFRTSSKRQRWISLLLRSQPIVANGTGTYPAFLARMLWQTTGLRPSSTPSGFAGQFTLQSVQKPQNMYQLWFAEQWD